MSVPDHYVVVNYIIHRDWKIEKKLATNAIAYCQLRESNKLDFSKGSHVLLDKTSWRKNFMGGIWSIRKEISGKVLYTYC